MKLTLDFDESEAAILVGALNCNIREIASAIANSMVGATASVEELNARSTAIQMLRDRIMTAEWKPIP